jgi:hypothetical protein
MASEISTHNTYDTILQEYPDTRPTYTIEVTTREELDTQIIKDLLWNEFGEIPDIDNHGTYYRIEHKLTRSAKEII